MPEATHDAPRTDDLDGIAHLRRALAEADFTASGIRNALATDIASGRDSLELPLYLRLLEGTGPLGTLVKLFLLGAELPAPEVEAALPEVELGRLVDIGVVRREGDRVTAAIELAPAGDLLL